MRPALAEAVRCSERYGEIMTFSRSQPPATRFLAWVPEDMVSLVGAASKYAEINCP